MLTNRAQAACIVACCDMDEAMLQRGRERYGSDIFTTHDYPALLEQDLDAVFVATPDFWHEEHAIAALEAGKAVYLEKPLAITIPGCDRILETAVRTKGTLYLGHNMRHMAFVLKMKELLDSGAIGEVKTAWCRHFVGHGGDFYSKIGTPTVAIAPGYCSRKPPMIWMQCIGSVAATAPWSMPLAV
jgi:predicted dehydrogenase